MSILRARCPDCRTLTAVAVDDIYECHSCGRTFGAGLVRVPRAWGDGGEPMIVWRRNQGVVEGSVLKNASNWLATL